VKEKAIEDFPLFVREDIAMTPRKDKPISSDDRPRGSSTFSMGPFGRADSISQPGQNWGEMVLRSQQEIQNSRTQGGPQKLTVERNIEEEKRLFTRGKQLDQVEGEVKRGGYPNTT
jgi:hypothetical protein